MYGLPAQTLQQALADLDAALALEPAHISHYQLTLEPGTVFYHRPPPLPDSDAIWQMQLDCQERLAARGYEQYEVSAYARAGRRSRHNLNYWQFGDYIGVGAGAHGKLTWLASDERARSAIVRSARIKQPREFLRRAAGRAHQRSLRGRDRGAAVRVHVERAAADRRLRRGATSRRAPASRSRRSRDAIAEAQRKGLLQQAGAGRWRVTELGQRFLNDLQALFLPRAGGRRAVGRNDRPRSKSSTSDCTAACKFVNWRTNFSGSGRSCAAVRARGYAHGCSVLQRARALMTVLHATPQQPLASHLTQQVKNHW